MQRSPFFVDVSMFAVAKRPGARLDGNPSKAQGRFPYVSALMVDSWFMFA